MYSSRGPHFPSCSWQEYFSGSSAFVSSYILSFTTQLLAASSRLEKFVPDTLEDMASDIGQDALTTITRDQAVYDAASQAAQAAEVSFVYSCL